MTSTISTSCATTKRCAQKTIKHGRDLVHRHGALPDSGDRGGQRPGGRAGLQPGRAVATSSTSPRRAFFADPHVQIGLVAADGGPLVWPLADQPVAGQGVRVDRASGSRPQRAVELGLANHVVADPLAEAIACAKKILELPQQAVEATKRLMNIQLEQSVLASLDYANLAEYVSFGTADFNKIVDGLIAKK